MIKFDLSEIPSDFTVSDAKLKLYKYGNFPGFSKPGVYCIYKLTSDWEESGANWKKRSSSQSWAKPGGDFEPAAIDSFSYDGKTNGWFTYDVTPTVIAMVNNPDKNFGFIIRTPDIYANQNISMDQGSYFHSTEATNDELTPRLVVTDMTTGIITTGKKHPGFRIRCLDNTLSLRFPEKLKGEVSISVINFSGRVLYKERFETINSRMHIPRKFSPGSYCVTVKSIELNHRKKVLVY